jgi:hypothetical protein
MSWITNGNININNKMEKKRIVIVGSRGCWS